ncbi:MAG: TorF family putative porin [Gammaproteobacteria bacterium]|nr:TorF family putative porin [Gammaproteobacteria bacterium]
MSYLKTLIAGVLLACATHAHAEFSASVMLATDYIFRGISNTDGDPAIQGSFDYEHDNGFYAGIWASNVKFRENADEDAVDTVAEATIEIDYYAGLASEFGNGISWDIGAQYITYPGSEKDLNYDYWEALGALGYSFGDVTLEPEIVAEAYYSPDYFGKSGDATYITGILYLAIPRDFGVNISVGRQQFREDANLDYTDLKIGITRSLAGFDFELAYTDTNISKSDCDDEDICSSRVVFSIARAID